MKEVVLVVVMIAALYGIADLIKRTAFWLLFGKGEPLYLIAVTSSKGTCVEYVTQRLSAMRRYFPLEKIVVPLLIVDTKENEVFRVCERWGIRTGTLKDLNEMVSDGLQSVKKQI